ncbi:MAG: 5'/3'-nucleotidase SurE [Gammaproteobacteria bacterium]|nr:5'/3'-nucleotidase SurE [Gammaproteobacteria bacterium]
MKILLSNDDGYQSEGLATLALALADLAELTIVAPDRNQSGASHSLTLDTPLRVGRSREGMFYVNGTPTDCVHLAITGLLDHEPDMVIAGINHGANLGDDVLYSGTVAAAVEGRSLGLPAIAVSLAGHALRHFDSAGQAVRMLLEKLHRDPLPPDTILNVNVPDLPFGEIRGFEATRLGCRHRAEPVVESADPRGRPVFWMGEVGAGHDAGPGTDFHAIHEARISVTPLRFDLTHHQAIAGLAGWLP